MTSHKLRKLYLELRNVHDLSLKFFSKKTSEYHLTPAQFGILRTVPIEGMVNMSDLIRQVGCVPSNMTTIIKRMDREELVGTTKNPNDHRENLVYLTDKGKELRESFETEYQVFLDESYGQLTESEIDTLLALLEKLRDGLMTR